MGVVYRAKDPAIGRTVAVKTIRLSEFADAKELAQLRDRLMREAQSAGILSHPGIVTVYDVAEDEANAYIFMEFVDGDTLEKLLLAHHPPDRDHLLKIFRQTAAALDFAHNKGIIHRDIKPANLMVTLEGDAKIADFGVAKIMSQNMTVTGMVLGTPYYMSPEQVQGHKIDGRTDQFSLGVVAYEILTGRRPYLADTLATLILKIITEKPPAPESLNPTLDASMSQVFERVFAKSPEDRYPTCKAFVEDLVKAVQASEKWQPVSKSPGGETPSQRVEPEAETQDSAQIAALTPPTQQDGGAAGSPTLPAMRPAPQPPPSQPPPDLQSATAVSPVRPAPPSPPPADAQSPAAAPPRAAEPGAEKSSGSMLKTGLIAAAVILVAGAVFTWTQFGGGRESPPPPVAQVDETPSEAPAAEAPAELAAAPPAREPIPETPPPVQAAPPKPTPPPVPVVREHEVVISTTPPGAAVVLDNNPELSCVTPCPITLEQGRHTMSINLAGHREALKIFHVPEVLESMTELELMAGSLALRSNPPGATIMLNGEIRPEKTPALISLPAGTYDVELTLEGYQKFTDSLEIRDRVVSSLDVNW